MKLKTRLKITFVSFILLPLLLTILAFMVIGIYLMNVQKGYGIQELDYAMMSENVREFINTTDKAYFVLQEQIEKDPSKLEDREYLEEINSKVSRKSTYLIVRKNDDLYYAGNEEAAKVLFPKLPGYGDGGLAEDSGYYFDELEKYVKQLDFTFSDGSQGSVFVITKMNSLISKHLLIDMFIAIVCILIFTSLMLTQWINKGVLTPINESATEGINRGEGPT